jgi:hypothetical protein
MSLGLTQADLVSQTNLQPQSVDLSYQRMPIFGDSQYLGSLEMQFFW